MIKHNIKLIFASYFLIMGTAMMLSSCSDELVSDGMEMGRDHSINITMKPYTQAGDTRAAATSVTTTEENRINRIAYAIVNTSGTVQGSVQEIEVTGSKTSYSITSDNNLKTYLKEGYKVLVAVNCPKGKFSSCSTETAFKNITLTANEALCSGSNGSSVTYTNLPMYGEATASYNGTQNLTADVFVYHLVSKVTLTKLTISLKNSDTFTPVEMFLYGVPNEATVKPVSSGYSYAGGTNVINLNGESGRYHTSTQMQYHRNYLSTGSLTWEFHEEDDSRIYQTNLPVLYSTPEQNGEEGNALFFVIKGIYRVGGKGTGQTIYYSFYVNKGKSVQPNYCYNITATISSWGNTSIPYPSKADVNTSLDYQPVNVGDYLFNDGTWGLEPKSNYTEAHHPVAVIFSNQPSTIDQANGFTHGYALALAETGNNIDWRTSAANLASEEIYTSGRVTPVLPTGTTYSNDYHKTYGKASVFDKNATPTQDDIEGVLADMDGYTECKALTNSQGTSQSPYNTPNYFPAMFYSLHFGTNKVSLGIRDITHTSGKDTYTTSSDNTSTLGYAMASGTTTSGWYLGSVGQYYLAFKNLGQEYNDDLTFQTSVGQWTSTTLTTQNVIHMNDYLSYGASDWCTPTYFSHDTTTDSNGNFSVGINENYWSSSQLDDNMFIVFQMRPDGTVEIFEAWGGGYNSMSNGVRPVIAF